MVSSEASIHTLARARTNAIFARHGFSGAQVRAQDRLQAILAHFLREVVSEAARMAHLQSRRMISMADVVEALEFRGYDWRDVWEALQDTGAIHAAAASSSSSSAASEGSNALTHAEHKDSPARDATAKGLVSVSEQLPAFARANSTMPSFPATHTYRFTPTYPSRPDSAREIRELAAAEARNAEDSLRRLLANVGVESPVAPSDAQATQVDTEAVQWDKVWQELADSATPDGGADQAFVNWEHTRWPDTARPV